MVQQNKGDSERSILGRDLLLVDGFAATGQRLEIDELGVHLSRL
jgi:hypothetical protein